MRDLSYNAVMARRAEIMRKAVGIDYEKFIIDGFAFDYEGMMKEVGYSIEEVRKIQAETCVGNTPLVELKNINKLIKKIAPKGKGAPNISKRRGDKSIRKLQRPQSSCECLSCTETWLQRCHRCNEWKLRSSGRISSSQARTKMHHRSRMLR